MLARLPTGSLLPARGVGSRVSNSHVRHGGRPCFQLRWRRSRRCVVRSQEVGRSGPSTDTEDQAGRAPPPAEQRAAEGQPEEPQAAEGQLEEPQAAEGQPEEQASLQLPADVVQRLRTTVFGFTFFVTSAENYQADGVLFKGNLREEPALAYTKMAARLKDELGDAYRLYLLEDADAKPVAVVLPAAAVLPSAPPVNEALLAAALGACTLLATLNINGAELFNFVLLTFSLDPEKVAAAVPGTLALLAILGTHEAGHALAAKRTGVALGPPLFIPAGLGLLGSFGAITRIKSVVPDRTALAEVAASGPVAGAAVSLAFFLVGLALTAGGVGGVEVDVQSFKDSLIAGLAGQVVFGDRLFEAEALNANPLFVAGWAGLIINALNAIPAGELDGGRTFLALFGRRPAARMSAISFLLLAIFSFGNSLALYWLLLALTLQRTAPQPCENEVAGVRQGWARAAAIAALCLPLVVLLPYPLGGSSDLTNVDLTGFGL